MCITLSGSVEPVLKVVVPEVDRVRLDERVGSQQFGHPVQLVTLANVVDPPYKVVFVFIFIFI